MKKMNKLLIIYFSYVFLGIILLTNCGKESEKTEDDILLDKFYTNLTDDQKIGQLFCLTVDPFRYFLYPNYKKTTNILIEKYQPGAIFFSANLDTVKIEIQNEFNGDKLHDEVVVMQNISRIPLLIAASYESGAWYWDTKATRFPYPLALGATRIPNLSYRQGIITAVEAKAQGINWMFAPVMNNHINPDNTLCLLNSFGNDSSVIRELYMNFCKGCYEGGIATCIKYFPTENPLFDITMKTSDIDSVTASVITTSIISDIQSIITSPIDIDAMVSHNVQIVPGTTIYDIIHKQFSFEGLILTNILLKNDQMFAVDAAPILIEMVKSGTSMFILPEQVTDTIPVMDIILNEYSDGHGDINPINNAVEKICTLKKKMRFTSISEEQPLRSMAGIGLPEYLQTSLDIASASVTLVKNEKNLIPITNTNKKILALTFLDEFIPHYATFYDSEIERISTTITKVNFFGIPDPQAQYEAVRRSRESDIVICSFFLKPTNDQPFSQIPPNITNLMHNIINANKNVIVISYYSPYLINTIPAIPTYVVTYSPSKSSMRAALDVVFGNLEPSGKLPIALSEKYPIGYGL